MATVPSTGSGARRARLGPAERRAQIVEAAAEVFRGRDPSTVRFDEVAQAAGVSRSLVYAYFGDRGELIAAVYLHTLADLDAELAALATEVPVDERRFQGLVEHFLGLMEQNADSWRLFAAAGAIDHPAVQAARAARCQHIADAWGGGPVELMLARGVVGFLESAGSEWIAHRPCEASDAARVLSRALWRGLGHLPARLRD